MAVHVFHHHDRVVNHQADGDDHGQQGEQVERKPHRQDQEQHADQRQRDGHQRDDDNAQGAQEEKNHQHHDECGLYQGGGHLPQRRLDGHG